MNRSSTAFVFASVLALAALVAWHGPPMWKKN